MPISSTTCREDYVGDATTVNFPFSHRFLSGDDLKVYVEGVLQATGYSVSGAGETIGGTVTFDTAPAVGDAVVIFNDPSLIQPTDFVNNVTILEENIDDALDRVILAAQATKEYLSKAIRGSIADANVAELDFAANPSTFLFIDENGLPSLVASDSAVLVSYYNDVISAVNAAFESFTNYYLGAAASDPVTTVVGALYFDSTNDVLKVYNGATWEEAISALQVTADSDFATDNVLLSSDGVARKAKATNITYDGSAMKLNGKNVMTEVQGINSQTASYILALGDAGKIVEMSVAGANNLTVPPNTDVAFPLNTRIDVVQMGAGQTSIQAGLGVTIRSDAGKLKISGQYAAASLYKRATNEWVLIGSLSA